MLVLITGLIEIHGHVIVQQKQNKKHSNNNKAAQAETSEQEANVTGGNRIGPRLKTNLVEDEEYEIVANLKQT